MAVKFTQVKAEEIWTNAFVADEDKTGDQVRATIIIDGVEINAMADTEDQAIANLREKVNGHFNAKKYQANLEIDKALGIHFFD